MYAQLLSAGIGIWLMAAPAVLHYHGAARTNDRIVGPVIAMFALVAVWEVTRGLRLANLPSAIWLLLAPWILSYGNAETLNSLVAGSAVLALSLVHGETTTRYGGGWSMLRRRSTQSSR
ncbi:MAG: SPW repeat protein [Candidatus Korobacteraceae bacterium]